MKKSFSQILSVALIFAAAFFLCGTLQAAPKRAGVSTGDVLFEDGSVMPFQSISRVSDENRPVAVAAGIDGAGNVIFLGMNRSDGTPCFAPKGSAGHSAMIGETACSQKKSAGDSAENAQFTGLSSGSGSYEAACSAAGGISGEVAEWQFPALSFARHYGQVQEFSGQFASGWYLPSISEVCLIYKNRRAINDALRHLHKLDARCAMDGLGTAWYWSSSQSASQNEYVWFVHFFNGYAGECPKDFTNLHAAAVRKMKQ